MNLEPLDIGSLPQLPAAAQDARPVSTPTPLRRPRIDAKFCCLASVVNVAVLAISASAGAMPMQGSGVMRLSTWNEGLQPQQIAQDTTAAFVVADISGTSGQTIPLSVSLAAGSVNRLGLLMFRGMPGPLKFTTGFRTGDTWLISLSELENAKLIVPNDFQGSFNMDVTAVLGEGKQRQSHKLSVNITSKSNLQTTDTIVDPTSLGEETAGKKVLIPPPTISPSVEKTMLERAARLVKTGDVGAARLIYEHLAASGSAPGALSMAKTYDPEILFGLEVVGMKPDVALARRWYGRAAELGDEAAANRLKAFASSGR